MVKIHRRLFNYRPMCFAALALLVGIIVAEALYGENVALIAIPIGVSVLAFALLLIFKRTRKFVYIPLILLLGFASMSISSVVYDSKMQYTEYSEISDMTAKVSGMIYTDGESSYFYADDIYVEGERLKFGGYVKIYFAFEPDFNAGDIIYMRGYAVGTAHEKFDAAFSSAIASDNGYRLYISSIKKLSEGENPFPQNVQHRLKQIFYTVLDPDDASLCAALILGDKFGMDEEIKQGISAAGLAHILAVSGLHITTLSSALYFILKKLKVNPWISLIIVLALTFLYCMLCSFSSSALRAFIMSGVFNVASCLGKKRDNLSALSAAAILILIFRPTALFEAGFLLSFSSMLGIFLYSRTFSDIGMKVVNKISPKRKIGKRTVELLSATLSASLMSYPFVAYYFGSIPTLQVLSNLLFVPYMMVMYVVLLAVSVFALITTLYPAVYVMQVLLFPFKHYVLWAGGLSFAAIPTPKIAVPAMVMYLLVASFMSRYNLLPQKDKARGGIIAISASLVLCAAFALI